MSKILVIENCKDCVFHKGEPLNYENNRYKATCIKTGDSRDPKIGSYGILFDCPLPDLDNYIKIEDEN